MSRNTYIILLVLVVVLAGMGVWYFQKQETREDNYTAPVEKITMGGPLQEVSTLVYIAEAKGYFTNQRLDVTIKEYTSGVASVKGLVDGEIDIALSADFVLVSKSFDDSKLRVIASLASVDNTELVARRDHGIENIADLKRKTIGVTLNSSAHFDLGRFLTFHHLRLKDITIVDLPPRRLVEGILRGHLDAAVTWPPHVFTIKNELESNQTSWSVQDGHRWHWLAVTSKHMTQGRASVIEQFLKALIQAEEFSKTNEMEAQHIVHKRLDVTQEYMTYYWPRHNFVVGLTQAMLLGLEDKARWRIANRLTDKTSVPNYLNFIYLDALEKVEPQAVTIIR